MRRYLLPLIKLSLFLALVGGGVFAACDTQQDNFTGTPDDAYAFGGATWDFQTFTPASGYSASCIKILVYKRGTPVDPAICSLYETSGNVPTGSAFAEGSFDPTLITSDSGGEWITVSLSGTSSALTASTKYAIVCKCVGCTISTDDVVWKRTNAGGYSGGNAGYSANSGSSWTGEAPDLSFEVWSAAGGGGTTTASTSAIISETFTWPQFLSVLLAIFIFAFIIIGRGGDALSRGVQNLFRKKRGAAD